MRSATAGVETDITSLLLGGGSFLPTQESRWTLEAGNQTDWNAHGRRHRFKGLLWGRVDGLNERGFSNGLGSFAFNSIEDFNAGRASSFSRTLSEPPREGKVWNTAAALAHNFAPTRYFSLLYGARLEADGFGDKPARNPALEQALGVRTGVAPSRLHLSPRIGFTYTYNRDKDNGSGTMMNQTGTYFRSMSGTIRGGIGEFRDLLHPGILADASASTGLAGGTSFLNCVGAAVPTPDWSLFATDPSSIPAQCVNGSGVLAELAPGVTLIDPSYDVPRSWRASLDWNTSMSSWLLRVGTLVSYDLAQPGVVDANFGGVSKLTLGDEANRPVFVSAASIDPASGAVSAVESRKSDQYGGVGVRVSDLRGYGGQLNLALSPDVFKFRGGASFYGSIGYTLQATKRQYRGFDGAAFGDPRLREWAAGPNDARHIFVVTSAFSTAKDGNGDAFCARAIGIAVHAARAGRRERRRAQRRPCLHPRSGNHERCESRGAASHSSRQWIADGARMSHRQSGPRGAEEWVQGAVDAVAQHPVDVRRRRAAGAIVLFPTSICRTCWRASISWCTEIRCAAGDLRRLRIQCCWCRAGSTRQMRNSATTLTRASPIRVRIERC